MIIDKEDLSKCVYNKTIRIKNAQIERKKKSGGSFAKVFSVNLFENECFSTT